MPTGTGMMHRELRGDLGGGADLSEVTCLDHGHDPSERLDAAVRLASGGTRAENKNFRRDRSHRGRVGALEGSQGSHPDQARSKNIEN